MSGGTVSVALDRAIAGGSVPRSIMARIHVTRARDWAYQRGVQLDFHSAWKTGRKRLYRVLQRAPAGMSV
jgi:hypothetical protein